jgi:hypothetical protein
MEYIKVYGLFRAIHKEIALQGDFTPEKMNHSCSKKYWDEARFENQ